MIRHLGIAVTLAIVSAAIPLSAANKPRLGPDKQTVVVWTNDDLEKLHTLGLISIVGRVDDEELASTSVPETYQKSQDPKWYAEQAAQLSDELENRQEQLREYQQALDDTRSLRDTTGGINFDYSDDLCITPEGCIQILQQGVNDAQERLAALEDLARHNGIPPGVLRGQTF
jgi:hypothetical protein